MIEENPTKPGILVEGEFRVWWLLRPVYVMATKLFFTLYINQIKVS